MKKYYPVGILIVVAVAIGIGLCLKKKPLPEPTNLDAGFEFRGLTNIGPIAYATFQLTNQTDGQLVYVEKDFQFKNSDGSWQTNKIGFRKWIGYGDNLLEPHQEVVFHVPVPTNRVPWKLHLLCREHATGLSGAKDRVSDVVSHTKYKLNNPNGPKSMGTSFSGRQYDVVSEEISN